MDGNLVFGWTATSSRLASVGLVPAGAKTDSYPRRSESPPFFPSAAKRRTGKKGKRGVDRFGVAARRGFRRGKPDGGHMEVALVSAG